MLLPYDVMDEANTSLVTQGVYPPVIDENKEEVTEQPFDMKIHAFGLLMQYLEELYPAMSIDEIKEKILKETGVEL